MTFINRSGNGSLGQQNIPDANNIPDAKGYANLPNLSHKAKPGMALESTLPI
jgi:hypothetical protein